MKRILIIAPFLLIVQLLPLMAQTPSGYPTKQEVVTMLKDVDYVLRRFEEVSDEINFSRWNAPYALTDAAHKSLDTSRNQVRVTRSQIAEIEAQMISSRLLVGVYLALSTVGRQAEESSLLLGIYAPDLPLSTALLETTTAADKLGAAFTTLLYRQLDAQIGKS